MTTPTLMVSEAARRAFEAALADAGGASLRLGIDARFRHELFLGEREPGDIEVGVGGLTLLLDGYESVDDELFVDYAHHRIVHEIHESCRVLDEGHDEHGTRVRVRAPREVLARLRAALSAC